MASKKNEVPTETVETVMVSPWKRLARWLRLHHLVKVIVGIGLLFGLMLLVTGAYAAAYWNKVIPGVTIAGINVGNKTGEEAAKLIYDQLAANPEEWKVKVAYEEKEWEIDGAKMGVEVNMPETINQAWLVGRTGGLLQKLGEAQTSFFSGRNFGLVIGYDEDALSAWIEDVADEIDQAAVQPAFVIEKGDEVKVTLQPGENGLRVARGNLREMIVDRWEEVAEGVVVTPVETVFVPQIGDRESELLSQANSLLGKKLIMKADEIDWEWDGEELISWLGFGDEVVNQEAVAEAIVELAESVDRPPQNAAFQFANGRVEEFRPGKDGLELNQEALVTAIAQELPRLFTEDELVLTAQLTRTEPEITTDEVNNLGINTMIGKGESTYFHSIPNRVYNVGLAAARINGALVAPGETFSFNGTVGDISAATGYRTAYVISGGRTVLGDGGGVCQVSTTLFRAAMDAGLPIVERKAHAYRVEYYEQNSAPGIDATVYSPTVDLKFKNDTPGHILIQTVIDEANRYLSFEIYGTDDGRQVSLSKVKQWGGTPPPPPLYQDDPTLPVGTTKQVDWAAWGLKTSFDYKVTGADGTVIQEKTFYSNFQPWQAVYLRGTAI